MNRVSQLLAMALIGVITISTQSAAQKSYALGIGGGAAIPVGKMSDTQKTGVNGLVSLALGVAELPIGIRIDGVYNELPRSEKTLPVGSSGTSNLRILGVLGNAVYAFSGTSVKTYVIAGGGLYNTRFDVDGAKSENHLGLNAGAGMTFGLGPVTSFIEARYHFISRQPAQGGVLHFVPITFGLMF
jgi:outer membrane protein with beta-barrel domain